jgi:hypothetical protein
VLYVRFRGYRALLVLAILIYLSLALYLTRHLVTWDDEGAYLTIGYLATVGTVSLYQDDMTGQRMPLPFYVLGASQIVFGRSLWAGRIVSAVLGLGALALTMAVASKLGGPVAGMLAGLLFATQGVVVGYFATATYHALTALILMGTIWIFLSRDLPGSFALGTAAASLLFWSRTTMFPALPFFLAWALVGARTRLERGLAIAFTVGSPAVFFLSDSTHLKLLANLPFVDRFVAPLGYLPIFSFSAFRRAEFAEQVWAFALVARRYESWTLAATGLFAVALCARARGVRRAPQAGKAGSWDVTILAGLLAWMMFWHLVIFRANFRFLIGYFPAFAPLAPALLGVGFARWLGRGDLQRTARAVLAVVLAGAVTVSAAFIRHPLLPGARIRFNQPDAITALASATAQLRTLVPAGERVFLFAVPVSAYLAGLNAPPQQFVSPSGTLAPETSDPRTVAKSGVWSMVEIERWLGSEMQFALISESLLQSVEPARPAAIARIRELLSERFVRIGRIGDASWLACDVYRRRG